MSDNSLNYKPNYTAHRRLTAAVEIPLDTATLATLIALPGNNRASINCRGWNTIDGVVVFTGGTNVTLQPIELVRYTDAAGVDQEIYTNKGTTIGPLVSGDSFTLTVAEGLFFLRLAAKTGNQTALDIYVAGGTRANVGAV